MFIEGTTRPLFVLCSRVGMESFDVSETLFAGRILLFVENPPQLCRFFSFGMFLKTFYRMFAAVFEI